VIHPSNPTRPPRPVGGESVDARSRRASASATSAVTGLVLCGGRSSRLGRDKALEPLEGAVLVVRAARVIESVLRREASLARSSVVRLACGPNERYTDLGYPCVTDRYLDQGPLAGIEAGLTAARRDSVREHASEGAERDRVIVLACDLPFVDATLLSDLLAFAERSGADLVSSRSERGLEPLVSVWTTAMLEPVRAALERGDAGVHALVASAPRADHRFSCAIFDAPASAVTNVNTSADLESARERCARAATREIA